ncbi:N-acetyltransferase [Parashewanella spongiae]|uniref:N-acetyltransferase n=1 Tax=Parashewanella spongiae TaxID=342950 RepID=A0A3A6U0P9_9GAMM|nr:GNAT family protein [Parashewanella spongiae]MCL1078966.1 GNAT family N-acetyltransferase [Parashewanella spongiae]RJY18893.1 N-acetyltransferase [Parashewanella spongiae]
MTQLETKNLSLCPLTNDDWSDFLNLNLDAEVNRYIRVPDSPSMIKEKFEGRIGPWTFESEEWLTLVIREHDGSFVGLSGFHCTDKDFKHVEVGYMLALTAQRKGYATESLKAIIDWGITHFDVHKFSAFVSVDNIASQRVLIKSGFQQEGLLRENNKVGDEWQDDYLFGLLSRDFKV